MGWRPEMILESDLETNGVLEWHLAGAGDGKRVGFLLVIYGRTAEQPDGFDRVI